MGEDFLATLDSYWRLHRPCLKNNSNFPVTLYSQSPNKYRVLFDEFEKLGYLSVNKKYMDVNHNPKRPEKILLMNNYRLTKAGKNVVDRKYICYGYFSVKEITKITQGVINDQGEMKIIDFLYSIKDIPQWALSIRNIDEPFPLFKKNMTAYKQSAKGRAVVLRLKNSDSWMVVKNTVKASYVGKHEVKAVTLDKSGNRH